MAKNTQQTNEQDASAKDKQTKRRQWIPPTFDDVSINLGTAKSSCNVETTSCKINS